MTTLDKPTGSSENPRLQKTSTQPENPFASLIPEQEIAIIPSFTLESGVVLTNAPVAYTTRGQLSKNRDNALVICHALTGSADVCDWWGPLIGGGGRAFDVTRFFVVCLNSLGSPYGSASPVTCKDGDPTQERYGPEFPLTTIRDDVNIHRLVLDDLGVRQIAAVVGGSMGGMLVLEYAFFGQDYVRNIVPIATSSRHSAWGISWGEAQRQSIYCDPKYDDGYYAFEDAPNAGLGAARMSALLTYRSRDSFESRFGRNTPDPSRQQTITDKSAPTTPPNEHWAVHNDGHKSGRASPRLASNGTPTRPQSLVLTANGMDPGKVVQDPQFHGATAFELPPTPLSERRRATTHFSAQTYLRYQGEKFVRRFDSNCYIAITRKLDTHDISRHRVSAGTPPEKAIAMTLAQIEQPALVLGIETDGLFTFAEQRELAAGIPDSSLRRIESPEGHDAFLLQFEQVNRHIIEFFQRVLPGIMDAPGIEVEGLDGTESGVGQIGKASTVGETDDFTAW